MILWGEQAADTPQITLFGFSGTGNGNGRACFSVFQNHQFNFAAPLILVPVCDINLAFFIHTADRIGGELLPGYFYALAPAFSAIRGDICIEFIIACEFNFVDAAVLN